MKRIAALRAAWAGLAPRERRLIALAVGLSALTLLWLLAIAPALRTLRQAPPQRAALQAQAQQLQALQAQAQGLQNLPRLPAEQALQALQATTSQRLGNTAQVQASGEQVTITLRLAPAAELAAWLADVRANARATPVQASLSRAGDLAPGAPVLWNGSLTLSLPAP